MNEPYPPPVDLGFLSSLGFGPDSPLMNEPRLLVDGRFLGAVLVELEDELGSDRAHAVFYQIGLFHGLRDGNRLVTANLSHSADFADHTGAQATPLAIALGPRVVALGEVGDAEPVAKAETSADSSDAATSAGSAGPASASIEVSGEWPERYEAQTRLVRLGPTPLASCWLSAGYTAGWLSASFDADMVVVETECAARGDDRCCFRACEVEHYRNSGDLASPVLIDSQAFERIRTAACAGDAAQSALDESPLDEPDEPSVHVWGPVMVLPFTDVDQALRTVEMLGREADTTEVRAVVLDLRSAPLDEGYGAAALEQVLECVEAWGAEPILTGVADLSENVVAGLETARLLVRKDISEAIATAFQIAEVQRYLL